MGWVIDAGIRAVRGGRGQSRRDMPVGEGALHGREEQIEQLIDRLPGRLRRMVRWLRRPTARWVRIPTGVLLIAGGFLGFLPVLGLWMLPLGLVLLAEDVPLLRRARDRLLDRLDARLRKGAG